MAASCGPSAPVQGASYLQVANNGTVSATIMTIAFNYVDMVTSTGAPSGNCVIAAGTTTYITLTGIGTDPATAGEPFNVSLTGTNGEFTNVDGTFG